MDIFEPQKHTITTKTTTTLSPARVAIAATLFIAGTLGVSTFLTAMLSSIARPVHIAVGPSEYELRKTLILQAGLDNPFPSLDSSDPSLQCLAEAGYALLALYLNNDPAAVSEANNFIENSIGITDFGGAGDPASLTCYWALPFIQRIYLTAATYPLLTEGAKQAIENAMFDLIYQRSNFADIRSLDPWEVEASENHHLIRTTSYFLAAQILEQAGRTQPLMDGLPSSFHRIAWEIYWQSFFNARAREGLHLEVASAPYEKWMLINYYNIRDFSQNAELRQLAENILTLHWADTAQEYLSGVGVRGGAATRVYKNNYLTKGSYHSSYAVLYAYGWHNSYPAGVHPASWLPLTSTYQPPDIITAIATDNTKPPYTYVSRRPGMGDRRVENRGGDNVFFYTVRFDSPEHNANIRRESYITPEYILGSLAWDPQKTYTELSTQNRVVGAVFAPDTDARLLVIGRGDAPESTNSVLGGKTTGYSEVSGILKDGALIVARDPKAVKSNGTRIYISDAGGLWESATAKTLYDHGIPYSNEWLFARSGDAYVAFRIAEGGYTVGVVPTGVVLELMDMWSPVLIEIGRAANYSSFVDFQNAIESNQYSYAGGKLDYTTESGSVLTFWKSFAYAPMIDGIAYNLNPPFTYKSPYISGLHGDNSVTVSYPGYAPLVLNFSITNDIDGDGIRDSEDTCLSVYNAVQKDTDHDGYGNRCDADFNNDGIVGASDFNDFRSHYGTADALYDLSGDGVVGSPDFNIMRMLWNSLPGPSGLACAGSIPCP